MTQKFWQLLNWPASHGPFWPKLIIPLATVFVEILLKEKNWRVFRPYLVTLWKEFEISLKNGILKIFERVNCPGQFCGTWFSVQSPFSSLRLDCREKEIRLYKTLHYEKVHLQTNIYHMIQVWNWKLLNYTNYYIRFPCESIH